MHELAVKINTEKSDLLKSHLQCGVLFCLFVWIITQRKILFRYHKSYFIQRKATFIQTRLYLSFITQEIYWLWLVFSFTVFHNKVFRWSMFLNHRWWQGRLFMMWMGCCFWKFLNYFQVILVCSNELSYLHHLSQLRLLGFSFYNSIFLICCLWTWQLIRRLINFCSFREKKNSEIILFRELPWWSNG